MTAAERRAECGGPLMAGSQAGMRADPPAQTSPTAQDHSTGAVLRERLAGVWHPWFA